MRVLVTGRKGQLARCLMERSARCEDLEVISVGRPDFDLDDIASIEPAISAVRPDIIVSAAAYTAVDRAEDEPDVAYRINETGAGELALVARSIDIPIIHLSTDYVFSGTNSGPHSEDAPTDPQSAYGASKLAGEVAVRSAHHKHLIIRTAWLFSPFGENFVKKIVSLARRGQQLRIVDDQQGNPTSAHDLADAILLVIRAWRTGERPQYGVYHCVGAPAATWCSFGRYVLETSRLLGGPHAEIEAIGSAESPTKALRPKDSRLSCNKFAADYGYKAVTWKQSANIVIQRLLEFHEE